LNCIDGYIRCLTRLQESPHEHQQSQLLSRIITNVVCEVDSEESIKCILTHIYRRSSMKL
jgi:hypothetical protein